MNFEFSEEQNLLREQARGFLADNCPMTRVRSVLEADEKHDAELWGKIAEMGWTATVIPEEFGGLGYGYTGLGLVLEQVGHNLSASPLQSTVLIAASVIAELGSQAQKEQLLPAIASGEKIVTLALQEGEILAMSGAGAYGFTMSSNYNSRPRAAEVMVSGSDVHLVRERETFADLVRGEACLPDGDG